MRMYALLALALAAAAAAPAHGQPVKRVPLTPDEAALACMARAERAVARRHGTGARPAGRFESVRLGGGWRVQGAYELGAGERVRVACEITPEKVSVVTRPLAE